MVDWANIIGLGLGLGSGLRLVLFVSYTVVVTLNQYLSRVDMLTRLVALAQAAVATGAS